MAKNGGWSYYTIPDNFIDEGRIFNGMFRVRYFIEAVLYALVFAFFAVFVSRNAAFNTKVTCVIILAGPPFALGVVGINGEPVYKTVAHVWDWFKKRDIMLYDHTRRVLTESPVMKMMDQTDTREQLVALIERMRDKRIEHRVNREFVLGENFEFASDPDYTRDYIKLEEFDGNIEELVDVEIDFSEDSFFEDMDPKGTAPMISLPNMARFNLGDICFKENPNLHISSSQFNPTALLEDGFVNG